jgi:hypothetical protein
MALMMAETSSCAGQAGLPIRQPQCAAPCGAAWEENQSALQPARASHILSDVSGKLLILIAVYY